jgi:hypothetical protein
MNQNHSHPRTSASPADAKGALLALFEAFPADRGEGTLAVGTYLIAIEGYSLPAIEGAVRRIIRGEADGIDMRFLPTPAQLGNLVRYMDKLYAPVEKPLALPAPGSEALTEEEVARRQAIADRARERFDIKRTQGETITDRDAIPEAKRAELERAVKAQAERIAAEGLPKLSEEARALFREQAERAVSIPADQFGPTPSQSKERAA